MSRSFRSFLAFAAICFATMIHAVESVAIRLWDFIVPETLAAGPRLELARDRYAAVYGDPLDPAMLQSLRHEAGMKRMAASRFT